ncbi:MULTISPECIES: hypothetical protein [unclassified Paenibacillus]|uniref:hypothetical protein n=1 Tax=unclassified Paenibacillus TaxID=185978 RepID=UPI00363AA07E
MLRKLDRTATLYLPLLLIMFFTLLPFYWTVVTSLKLESDINKIPVQFLPNPLTFENFKIAWTTVGFSVFFKILKLYFRFSPFDVLSFFQNDIAL